MLLRPVLAGLPVIVIGYLGSEPSVMDGLFGQNKEGCLDFPQRIFWCIRHGETPHPYVGPLCRRIGSNFTLLHVDGFDELFADFAQKLVDQDRYSAPITLGEQTYQVSGPAGNHTV